MNRVVKSGNARTNNHRGTVTLSPSLKGMPTDYAVLVTAAGAILADSGAHVIGYELDAANDFKGFEVYTDEAIGDFSWIVVQLVPVETIAELRALPAGMVRCLPVLGYYASCDGGGGTFYWDPVSKETDNAGTIIQPNEGGDGRWKRLGADTACDIQVRWFGAKGDGLTDDTTAIRNAITFAALSGPNSSVIFGKGIFIYSETIWVPWNPDYRLKDQNDRSVYLNFKGRALGNNGVSLIGSRDAAAQQGSMRPATVLRWQGSGDSINAQLQDIQDQRPFNYSATFVIASGFTSFRDMAVENNGIADYFAAALPAWQYQDNGQVISNPTGAERMKFYGVSCAAGANGVTNPQTGSDRTAPFTKGFLWCPPSDYSRMERCEFAAAAPVIIDMDGTDSFTGSGTTTFRFLDNVLDSFFDTDVFRITNCPVEILTIINNTFNAQPNSANKDDTFFKQQLPLPFIYSDSGLTVVNCADIDKDPAIAGGSLLGNLIFRDNEYDDTAYDIYDDPPKFSQLNDDPPTLSPEETKRLKAEVERLPRVRMLKLRRVLNLELANNNIEGNGSNAAIVDLMDSVAHVGTNFAHSTTVLIQTLDQARQDLPLDPASYAGIVKPNDLQIVGPNGAAWIRATLDADDAVSHIERAKSAIATAKAINDSRQATGVTASVWAAVYTLGGAFAANVNIDGLMQSLEINGQPVMVNLNGANPMERMQQLIEAVKGLSQLTGVTAQIRRGYATLSAPDGRNISLSGTGTSADANSVGKEVLNFTTAVLAEAVVARGGVTLQAAHDFSSFSKALGLYGWGPAGRARVFFKHNDVNFGNVGGLVNKDTSAGIVKMTANPDQQVIIFGQLGDPGGTTTFQFDIPDNQIYTISVAESQNSPPYYGTMTRGQKVLVVVRNIGDGTVKFSDQFKTSGTFTTPRQGTSRAILFEYVGTVDYLNDPQRNGYMVERWCGGFDVQN